MSRDALLALLLAAYLLTADDISTLAAAIAVGYLASMQAAYREAAGTVGSDDTWTPDEQQQEQAQAWARNQAQGIADTYNADLQAAIVLFLDAWTKEQGSLDGAQRAAPAALGAWSKSRAQWKGQQISNYSCGSGADAGTSAFLVDLENGMLIDTETGEVVEIGDYAIGCLPEESSSDICKTVAGQMFDISERDSLPDMPNHPSCPHEYVIVQI